MGRVWGISEGECGVCMRERAGRVWGMYEGKNVESVGYI